MKNIIENTIITIVVILFGCTFVFFFYYIFKPYTQEEIAIRQKNCELNGEIFKMNADGSNGYCFSSPVEHCIDKWIQSVDEKYENPDTVSNLRETEYTEVIKQCQETFGNK